MEQKINLQFSSLIGMMNALTTDEACRVYLESRVWADGVPTCPYCGSRKHYCLKEKGIFKGLYKCAGCSKRYNVNIGTMFEGSHIGLRKWFIAIYIMSMHKKGISSHQLATDLGITQKSAWFVLSRIRNAYKIDGPVDKIDGVLCPEKQLAGVIEADETFVGGKEANRHRSKKFDDPKISRTKSKFIAKPKTIVFGIMQREGKVRTFVVPNRDASTLQAIITEHVAANSRLITDGHHGYSPLKKEYEHIAIKHVMDNYQTYGDQHTNGIEGYWGHLKRGIYGIYHQVSPKHLQKYCDEFSFRYNERKESVNARFDFPLQHSSRLKYKELIAK